MISAGDKCGRRIACMVTILAICCWGCGEEMPGDGRRVVDSSALAAVGEVEIDEQMLHAFENKIQDVHRSTKKGVEGHREHLLSLIDIKLMVMEAEAMGLDRDPDLEIHLQNVRRQAMIEAYLRNTVGRNIEISEEELRESFEAHPASHAVLGGRILLSSKEEADRIYREIEEGASFEEMAKKYSLDRVTGENGGAFKHYFTYDQVSGRVFSRVFGREKGDVLEPFRTQHGWEVVKVVDKKKVDFEKYRPTIQYATLMQKFDKLKKEHIAVLEEELHLRLEEKNLGLFLDAWNRNPGAPALTVEQLRAPVYTYDGGEFTIQDVVDFLHSMGRKTTVDSSLVATEARRRGLVDSILLTAARENGFADHSEVARKAAETREKWLLEALWKKLLDEKSQVSEEEAREHYDANPELYKAPEEIVIQEILVATLPEAEELLEQINQGVDLGELASEYSLRMYAKQNAGLYAIRPFERLIYRELITAADKAPIGKVVGPVRVTQLLSSTLAANQGMEEGYSIFKVLEKVPGRVKTFEESRRLADFYARQAKQQERLKDLNLELRRKYIDQWGINEENLAQYTREVEKAN